MFSPYYAWARARRGTEHADPLDHCAINVALYGRGARRWTMTERGRNAVDRCAHALSIGPSSVEWEGDTLVIKIDERSAPLPRRVIGEVRVHPHALARTRLTLDDAGAHRWQPIAPCAHVETDFRHPDVRWSGAGYLDSNEGDSPLEDAFERWDWSRMRRADATSRDAAVLYDIERSDGTSRSIALRFDAQGRCESFDAPKRVTLASSAWGVSRSTRSESVPRIIQTLEDGPFYARSHLATRLFGADTIAIHESLALTRFRAPWVRAMLPFRMPRRGALRER